MAINRIRQHVNPLGSKFKQSIELPQWQQIYAKPQLFFHLDIGCAKGKFLLEMAQLYPDINFLGIEIRQSLVIAANYEKERLGLTNLHYIFGSINYSASHLLASLPVNSLKYITVQFPDPWFKRKHQKRRVIQPELVDLLVEYLRDEGTVFLQSDIQEVAVEMKNRFAQHPLLVRQHSEAWLNENPFPVATERELYVLKDNLPVYRALFKKEELID